MRYGYSVELLKSDDFNGAQQQFDAALSIEKLNPDAFLPTLQKAYGLFTELCNARKSPQIGGPQNSVSTVESIPKMSEDKLPTSQKMAYATTVGDSNERKYAVTQKRLEPVPSKFNSDKDYEAFIGRRIETQLATISGAGRKQQAYRDLVESYRQVLEV